MTAFRCAETSLSRSEPLIGTASTVRAFVLVEFPGAWGRDALRDARLPSRVRRRLVAISELGIKTLLIRRHRRTPPTSVRHLFVAYSGPNKSWLETARMDAMDDLLDLDLTAATAGESVGLIPAAAPLVCVCTHGRHDPCCAELGRPLAAELSQSHPDLVWEASHIGGDRFAGNLVILPDGLYYGRVSPDEAPRLVEAHLNGHLDLDHLRGRSRHPFAVQAAECSLRLHLGETRLDALRLAGVRRTSDVWEIDFAVGSRAWRVLVRVGRHEPAQLTCALQRLATAPSFELVDVTELR